MVYISFIFNHLLIMGMEDLILIDIDMVMYIDEY